MSYCASLLTFTYKCPIAVFDICYVNLLCNFCKFNFHYSNNTQEKKSILDNSLRLICLLC